MISNPLITTRRIRIFAIFVLVICSLVSSLGYAISQVTQLTPDDISRYELRFAPLKTEIPENLVIGYVNDEKNTFQATRKFYAAQYVLSPRILVNRTDNAVVIADFDSTSAALSWRADDFVLIKDFGQGVVLYNRRTK